VTDRNLVRLAAGCAVLLAAGCGGAAREAATAPVSAHPAHTAGSLTAVQVIRDQLDLPPPDTS